MGSQDAVYSIFERLNTGGSPLQPQEIRVALYHGSFLKGISRLNEDLAWRELYGPASARFKDHELILRVLALYEDSESYARPVKSFLNHYLEKNRTRDLVPDGGLGARFVDAMRHILIFIGPRAFRPVRPINAAVVDSVGVGLMRRLEAGNITKHDDLKVKYDQLLEDEDYRNATTSSTASEESVDTRLATATDAFAEVE